MPDEQQNRPRTEPKRLKVLMSAYACEPHKSSEPGVGWNTVVNMAREHEIWVLTVAEHRQPIEAELAIHPQPNVHWIYADVPYWMRFWRKGERGRRIHYYLWQILAYFVGKRYQKAIAFDVAHHVTYVSYWTPSYLALLNIPFVWGPVGGGESAPPQFLPSLTSRGRNHERLRDFVRWLADKFDPFLRMAARKSQVSLVTTKETEARVAALGTQNIEVITDILFDEADIDRLAALPLEAKSPCFRVLSIGRLLDWKGFHLSIQAFARFHQQFPQSEYIIIGEGPQEKHLKEIAKAAGLEHLVRFTGLIPREEVMRNLLDAHVLIHPSLHETGGWVCVEAMAVGRPVICLNLGGPGQQITAETGILVPAESPEQVVQDLAEALLSLAQDPERRLAMGLAARQRVRELHNWERRIEYLSAKYREAIRLAKAK